MGSYLVTWKIDIDADSPREAAEKALEIQRDPMSQATVFEVLNKDTEEECALYVDLEESEEVNHG